MCPSPFVGPTITQVCWVAQISTGAHGIVSDFEEPPQYRFELPTSYGIFRKNFRTSATKPPGMMEIQIPKQTSTLLYKAGGVFALISHDKTNPMSLIDP